MRAAYLLAIFAAAAPPAQIKVLDAVYGNPERGRMCDATLAIGQQCDDRAACLVSVSNGICGDPDYHVAKRLFITFKCGPAPAQTLVVTEASVVRLGCEQTNKPTS